MKSFLLSLRGTNAPAAFLLVTFTAEHLAGLARNRVHLSAEVTGMTLAPDLACQYRLVEDFSLSNLPADLIALTEDVNTNFVRVPDELLLRLQSATIEYNAEEDEDNIFDAYPHVEGLVLEKYGVYFEGYDLEDSDETFDTTTIPFEELLGE